MRLRLVSNCMSLPCSLFYPVFNETTTFNRNFHLSPLSNFFLSLHLLGVANLYTVFFSLSPYSPDTFISSIDPRSPPSPPPFLISPSVEARIKRLRERAGRKYIYIWLIFDLSRKRLKQEKKINLPVFLCFFSVCLRLPIRPSPCYHPFRAILGGDLKCDLTFDEQEYDLFFIILKNVYIYDIFIYVSYILHVRMNPLCRS